MVVLDFLSRAFAVLLAIGGIIGFFTRHYIARRIDAHFAKKAATDHQHHMIELENKKAELAKDLATETEQLRSKLTKDLEREKRALDEEFRRTARKFDKNSSYYEIYEREFGAVMSELWALHSDYMTKMNQEEPLAKAWRQMWLTRAHRMLVQSNENLALHGSYIDPELNLRVAALFNNLSKFIGGGASDKAQLDGLASEQGRITDALRKSLNIAA